MANTGAMSFLKGFAEQGVKDIEETKADAKKEYDRHQALAQSLALEEYKTQKQKRDNNLAFAEKLANAGDTRLRAQLILAHNGHSSEDVNYYTGQEYWESEKGKTLAKAIEEHSGSYIDWIKATPETKFNIAQSPEKRQEFIKHAVRGSGLIGMFNAKAGGTVTRMGNPPSPEQLESMSKEFLYQGEDTRGTAALTEAMARLNLGAPDATKGPENVEIDVERETIVYYDPNKKKFTIESFGADSDASRMVSTLLDNLPLKSTVGKQTVDKARLDAATMRAQGTPEEHIYSHVLQVVKGSSEALNREIAGAGLVSMEGTDRFGNPITYQMDPASGEVALSTKQEQALDIPTDRKETAPYRKVLDGLNLGNLDKGARDEIIIAAYNTASGDSIREKVLTAFQSLQEKGTIQLNKSGYWFVSDKYGVTPATKEELKGTEDTPKEKTPDAPVVRYNEKTEAAIARYMKEQDVSRQEAIDAMNAYRRTR